MVDLYVFQMVGVSCHVQIYTKIIILMLEKILYLFYEIIDSRQLERHV